MMIKNILLGAAVLCGGVLSADAVFQASKAADWEKARGVTVKADGSGIAAARVMPCTSKFALEKGAVYTVSGEFRAVGENINNVFFGGLEVFDANGKSIEYQNVTPVGRFPVATVAAAAKKGDKELKLTGALKWKIKGRRCLAFDAKADRSDLPNFNISPSINVKASKVNADGTATIVLVKPLAADVAEGTKVRLHAESGHFIYCISKKPLTGEWQSFSGKISFKRIKGVARIHAGATQGQVKFLMTGKNRKAKLEFRNIKVEKQ